MPYRWVVHCKSCEKEFTFNAIDEQQPRETVNNIQDVDPPKPALRGTAELRTCPYCGHSDKYESADLKFRGE
jgi:hypothetical protein